jgi:hypothetical protein
MGLKTLADMGLLFNCHKYLPLTDTTRGKTANDEIAACAFHN